jgi:hypothetical protein
MNRDREVVRRRRAKCLPGFLIVLSLFFFLPGSGYSQEILLDKDKPKPEPKIVAIPYPFFNESIGAGAGVAVLESGHLQPQNSTVMTALSSIDGNWLVFLSNKDLQMPLVKRLFLSPVFFANSFEEVDTYQDGNPNFPNERAGSNDSDEDNFIEADADDYSVKLWFNYLLPIGHGKDHIISEMVLDEGITVSGATGGSSWNPLRSGRTYIKIAPFIREKEFKKNGLEETLNTSGVEFQLEYNNTDYQANPSIGSALSAAVKRDWGKLDSDAPWTAVEFEYEKYFSLGPTDGARQRVIAFNFWTAEVPTWDSFDLDSNGNPIFHRPPLFEGATLGGLWRLRGFPANSFFDKSEISYAHEYRHIPRWNPLKNFTLGGRLDWDWLQFVGFGEVGRVSPTWTIDELHSSMKWSAGAGVRAMVNKLVVRIDFAASDETTQVQVFIKQPFGYN